MKFVSAWRIGMTMCAGTRRCHIVLTGMMGVGKSTVGPLLAHSLHRDFRDVDQVVIADENTGGQPEFARVAADGPHRQQQLPAPV